MSIKVDSITKVYGTQRALDDISFEIPSGQVVGFLGPNGAGKSTMMKIITGFIAQTSGSVEVNGHPIDQPDYDFRKEIGYLPESNPLYHDMYVREYLLFVASIHKLGSDSKKRVNELIDITGIGHERNKLIGSLSKGYRQRVGLAQALLHNPSVLILDEPTSGLDPNQIVEIRKLIVEVGKKKTVMLSTHIMQEVEAICQRIIIINKGKLAADGSNAEVKSMQAGKGQSVLVEFLEEIPQESLLSIPEVLDIQQLSGTAWLLQTTGNTDIRPFVFKFAVANGYTLVAMQKKTHRLEDVFQLLTLS
jgi:ABC-2 type transport system ATP-binding protein